DHRPNRERDGPQNRRLGNRRGKPLGLPRGEGVGSYRWITVNVRSTCSLSESDQAVENVEKQDGVTCSGGAIECQSPKSLKLPRWAVKCEYQRGRKIGRRTAGLPFRT